MTIRISARMAHWGIRIAAVGVVLGFAGGAQPVVQAQCGQLYCVQGDNGCDADEHYAYQTFMGTRNGDDHFSCVQATCDDRHSQCIEAPVPPDAMEALEQAALVSDRPTMEAILADYPSLTVNVDRSAVQQSDCAGSIVAHIPVAPLLAGELSTQAQR